MSGGLFGEKLSCTVSLRTGEQLEAVSAAASDAGVRRVYLPTEMILSDRPEDKESINRLNRYGISEIFAALPYMLREDPGRAGEEDIRRVLDSDGISGALVRNLEEAAFLKEIGYTGTLEADEQMAPWNRAALRELMTLTDEWTVSPELNLREIREMTEDAEHAAIVVYGRAPMMVSANCVRRTTGRCTGAGEPVSRTEYLRDRKGMRLPVITDCRNCCNVILNAVPRYLGKYLDRIAELGIGRARVDLTTETGEETRGILRGQVGETTAGRFVKGVL